MKYLIKNKKGVFGLTAVQSFFAIILGIALLAYIIVIIMGVLSTSAVLGSLAGGTLTGEVFNQSIGGLSVRALPGCSATIISIINSTGSTTIPGAQYSLTGCTLTNLSSQSSGSWIVNYTYTTLPGTNANTVLTNTSTGIAGFFSSIQPVYAILAILVIILVLVVLVRVVQPQNSQGGTPSL